MTRLRRAWLTSLPAAWLFGAVFVVAVKKLCEMIPFRAPDGTQGVYYVVSHDRYAAHIVLLFAIFAGVYALLPRITRFGYRRPLGWLHFWLAFIGIDIGLLPMLIVPRCCLPARVEEISRPLAIMNGFALAGLLISGFAMLTFVALLVEAFLRKTPRAK